MDPQGSNTDVREVIIKELYSAGLSGAFEVGSLCEQIGDLSSVSAATLASIFLVFCLKKTAGLYFLFFFIIFTC